ncbi:ParB N-terminal domain-containing protein [Pseudonocardia sp. C8]|uniref:ParB/RepB/Spo0J family partition protein n=1 Tax=Pseudonocardia sp. C8 TaxID=2762759 RepID=UPI001642975A|nr:ParB N-terminal domain-containing protein [Pseudonocardia sp. C8]
MNPDDPTTPSEPEHDTELGALLWADPAELEIEINTRTVPVLDAHFVASIRDRGVREPVTVRRRASDGRLVVRKGTRRTLAAVRVGLERIRVLLEPDAAPETTTDRDEEAERIIDQLGENQHRAGITDRDEVHAHQELLELGFSPAEIARRTHSKADRIRTTTSIARSPLAAGVMDRYDLDLTQLAVIAEFDDDAEAVKELTVAARRTPQLFDHIAQRLRMTRAREAAERDRLTELAEAGVTILDRSRHPDAIEVQQLRPRVDDEPGTILTDQQHTACPGHAISVTAYTGREGVQCYEIAWCTEPTRYGHTARFAPATASQPAPGRVQNGEDERDPGVDTGFGDDDEDAASWQAAAEEQARRVAAVERIERERIRIRNEAVQAAEAVRRSWLATFLSRKNPPKDAVRYCAASLAHGISGLDRSYANGHALARGLLGTDTLRRGSDAGGQASDALLAAIRTATPGRATVVLLAIVLAGHELSMRLRNWVEHDDEVAAYLRQLEEWGYDLAPIEQLMVEPQADIVVDGDMLESES